MFQLREVGFVTPDTSEPCYSVSTLLASSIAPRTPAGIIDMSIKIVLHDTTLRLSIAHKAALDFAIMKQWMSAFAQPSQW
jgi:hypothetical protein